MNVMQASRSAEPAAVRRPDSARTDAARTDPSRTESTRTDRSDDDDAKDARDVMRRPTRPEFAAMLALLAGAGPRVRSDLLQQMPREGASLVDRLLDGAADESLAKSVDDAALAGPLDPSARPVATTGMPTAAATTPDLAPVRASAPTTDEASEALRYGMLKVTPDPRAAATPTADVIDLAAYARARDRKAANAILGSARAAVQQTLRGEAGDDQTTSALSRLVSQRGASTEQLRALGDDRGADIRSALDAILSKAGTPAGLRLAQQGEAPGADQALGTANAIDTAMLHAAHTHAAHALSASLSASAADVSTPIKDLDGVAPELRARIDRVIERMKNEYGHDVTIVESVRSQARQDFLFAQGRTRPGQVVTWTRDSAHTRGEAVDVIIDGSWENAGGFARLQRIAREEGLRTLGMKDPGHLELPRNGQSLNKAAAIAARVDAKVERFPEQAQVAGVAHVAGVAGVARVADTASSAPTGPGFNANAAYAAQQNAGQQGESTTGNAFGRGTRDDRETPTNTGRKLGHTARDPASGEPTAFGSLNPSAVGPSVLTGTPQTAGTTPAAGSEQAQRVSDIQQLRADAPAGPLTRMTLNVDGANGTQERITVDLRGNTVDTFITTNPANVDKLRMHSGELQDALSRHGLESETVTVRAATKSDSADAVRTMLSERDALKLGAAQASTQGDGANANSQRDRTPSRDSDKQDDARREQANRARDEKPQDGQQRGRRNPFTGTE